MSHSGEPTVRRGRRYLVLVGVAVAVVAAVAVAATRLGENGEPPTFTSPYGDPALVVERFYEAVRDDDCDTALGSFTEELRAEAEVAGGCGDVAEQSDSYEDFEVVVGEPDIEERRATVPVTFQAGSGAGADDEPGGGAAAAERAFVELVVVDDAWVISGFLDGFGAG